MSKDDHQISLPFAGGSAPAEPTADRPPSRPTKPARPTKKRPAAPTADQLADARPQPPPAAIRAPRAASEPPAREVLTVARLDRLIKRLLEDATADVLVQGEVSGLRRAGSGHCYFNLKDEREDAIIDCVMYRSAPARARKRLADGEKVVLAGRATLYPPRGRMQFVAEDVLQTARGALLEALERLKKKLAAEGLFDERRKKPLPRDPRVVAVLTSRDGAAVHDVVRVAHRRGGARLLLVPTPVQGAGAGPRIARAIALTDRLGVDAIIVTRGGGSAEDLAAYNDEAVVRAIAAAETPIVSAVGHEIDISLSDLAADARAATPSQAAELLIPDEAARRHRLGQLHRRLDRAIRHSVHVRRSELRELRSELGEPRTVLRETSQRFDDLVLRAERALRRELGTRTTALRRQRQALDAQHPRNVLATALKRVDRQADLLAAMRQQLDERRRALDGLVPRLATAMRRRLDTEAHALAQAEPALSRSIQRRLDADAHRLSAAAGRLDALSPLRVLGRGYAIALDAEGRAIKRAKDLSEGDRVELRLHEGRATAEVTAIDDEPR